MSDNKNQDVSKMTQAIDELTRQVAQLRERVETIEKAARQDKEDLLAWVE